MSARIATMLLSLALICGTVAAADPRSKPVRVGERAPDFTLEDHDGRKVTLSGEWKTRPVVLIFYRGHW